MTTANQHTATPWRVGNHPNDDSGLNWREILTDGKFGPVYVGQALKEDAEFVVRAVNSHDALIAAATAFLKRIDKITTDDFSKGGDKAERETLRAALADARKGGK